MPIPTTCGPGPGPPPPLSSSPSPPPSPPPPPLESMATMSMIEGNNRRRQRQQQLQTPLPSTTNFTTAMTSSMLMMPFANKEAQIEKQQQQQKIIQQKQQQLMATPKLTIAKDDEEGDEAAVMKAKAKLLTSSSPPTLTPTAILSPSMLAEKITKPATATTATTTTTPSPPIIVCVEKVIIGNAVAIDADIAAIAATSTSTSISTPSKSNQPAAATATKMVYAKGEIAATAATAANALVAIGDEAATSALKFETKCFDDFSITNSSCNNNSNNNSNNTWHLEKSASGKKMTTAAAVTVADAKADAAADADAAASTCTSGTSAKASTCHFDAATTTTPATTTAGAASAAASISIPKWLLMLLMLFSILAQMPDQVAGEKSKHFYMQSLCKNHFLQQLYRKIDGAVLWSQNERNLDCIITFQTHSVLQRFMLRFDMLQLDCNDHLFVYDGAHAVSTPKADISCRNTKQAVSSILTRTNFVTLKYVTDNWGTDANGFKLVITSVKDPKHTCKDFTCAAREFCIHPDLLCDGVNHCGDNSDESVQNLCQNETTSTIFGVDMTWFVLIVVSSLLILSAIVVGISICFCRRQDDSNLNQNTAIQLHHTAETNGSSKHLHHYQYSGASGVVGGGAGGGIMIGGGMVGGGTLSREHTQLPSSHHHAQQHHQHQHHQHHQLSTQLPSGNWHHPAGPISGYHRIQRNLSKMSKVRPIWCLANFVN